MKKSYYHSILVLCIGFMTNAFAQTPNALPYQAVARNSNGNLLVNQAVRVRFSIHDGSATGAIVYQENQTPTTNNLGLFTVNIGQGTSTIGTFSDIKWGLGLKFTQVEMDITGGTNYVDMGTQQMMSVPYALYAANANVPGLPGPQGPQGVTGPKGDQGNQGLKGDQGIQGPQGEQGLKGDLGLTGATGPQGPAGNDGAQGPQGLIGLTGATGPQGPAGNDGAEGPIGLTGATGTQGPQGPAGNDGAQGPQGIQGSKGDKGDQGIEGPQGPAGSYSPGTTPGQMMYWNGSAWVTVAPGVSLPGNQAQTLSFCNGVPTWGPCPAALATLTTKPIISAIGVNDVSGGTIINDGGGPITARGVCWSTSPNPTLANNFSVNGSGSGDFNSVIPSTSINPGTLYYVRAYATNSAGTAYGNEQSYTTAGFVIGQPYQGGIIAYIDATGLHGLIAAASDLGFYPAWPATANYVVNYLTDETYALNSTAPLPIVSKNYGTGNANTNACIMAWSNLSSPYAALVCNNLNQGGYSDWYLPSWQELVYLRNNKVILGLNEMTYWNSSYTGPGDPYFSGLLFPTGQGFPNYLAFYDSEFDNRNSTGNELRSVRPVRQF